MERTTPTIKKGNSGLPLYLEKRGGGDAVRASAGFLKGEDDAQAPFLVRLGKRKRGGKR